MRTKKLRSEQFEEAKMLLMFISQNPRDIEENIGALIPLTKIKRIMKLDGMRLYRRLDNLVELGLIEFRNNHYETGNKSRKVFITDKADEIIYNNDMIIKYNLICNEYYKSLDLFNNVDKDILPLWARKNRRRMLKMSFLNGCMG
jgi:DNA-binding MarR family transcriptional regulator